MRFHCDGPSIPDILFRRCEEGNVVFFCGAGVSMNAGLPSFIKLTEMVINHFKPSSSSDIMKAFRPWTCNTLPEKVPLDEIFRMLHEEYEKETVNSFVTKLLENASNGKNAGKEHKLIKRISLNKFREPQIVTTNFDLLFERGEKSGKLPIHVPPSLPDPTLGLPIGGIVYLHGRLSLPGTCDHHYILSSVDFGMAYLSKGWAAKFINGLVENYTVVFIGYSAEDPPMKYLLQGLNWDGQFDRTKLFAFDQGEPENIETKWRDKGVTPIAYLNHDHLWKTLSAWAVRADNPREWRRKVVRTTKDHPRKKSPHERGQVAHVLRYTNGAQYFAEVKPSPHPEWICVLDSSTRTAKASYGSGEDAEIFTPADAYGLDDDTVPSSKNDYRHREKNVHLLKWRRGEENPADFHELGGYQVEGNEAMPPRLWQLTWWVGNLHASPVIAWWAARQKRLHPRLIHYIDWRLRNSHVLHERCRHVWSLILEFHRDIRNRGNRNSQIDTSWFDFERRLKREGWTHSVLDEFRWACHPRLDIGSPAGVHKSKPPALEWDNLPLQSIGQFKVKYLEDCSSGIDVTDDVLASVFAILIDHLSSAARMLLDIEVFYITTPSCYPTRESDGGDHFDEFTNPMLLFIELFNRFAKRSPELAKAKVLLWNENEHYFFRKLKLFALSKNELFGSAEVERLISSFNQDAFWDINVVRELLFVLIDRWKYFSDESRNSLMKRILAGPDRRKHWSEQEYPDLRDRRAALYARYIQQEVKLQGLDLPVVFSAKLNEIIARISNWSDAQAVSMVTLHGIHGGFVEIDESPDVLLGLTPSEIVPRARADADLQRDFDSLTERRPFIGLVKTHPNEALLALVFEANEGRFPAFAWSDLISEFPKEASPTHYRDFLSNLTQLPPDLIVKLRHAIADWLVDNLSYAIEFDSSLGWSVYDNFIDGLLSGDPQVANSEIYPSSKRTYIHAINGPFGKCVRALLRAVPGGKQKSRSVIPKDIKTRIEKILLVAGEGSDHAVLILMSKLDRLLYLDSAWSKERLISMLDFDHSASEPAWNGLFNGERSFTYEIARVIKPFLIKLYPWIKNFEWSDDVSERAATSIALMYVSYKNEPHGLNADEMREILQQMGDIERNQIIFWLGKLGKGVQTNNKDGWSKFVIPFINDVWPQEIALRTSASISLWIRLLGEAQDYFPALYEVVKRFLAPVEIDSVSFYRIAREVDEEKPMAVLHPESVLDLMNTVTSEKLSRPSDDLRLILTLIEDAEPKLATDSRFLRLIDLVEGF